MSFETLFFLFLLPLLIIALAVILAALVAKENGEEE